MRFGPLVYLIRLELQRSLVRVSAVPDIMRNAMRLGLEFDAKLLSEQVR